MYDKVPVKALAQEVSGNRVMYANFQSQHTPPNTLNYNVGANAKSAAVFTTWAEYPNHTLKQNRNYQVVITTHFFKQFYFVILYFQARSAVHFHYVIHFSKIDPNSISYFQHRHFV